MWRVRLKETILAEGKTCLVLASRYLSDFVDLFDRVLLLDEQRIVELPLPEAIERFSTLSGDDRPNPLLTQRIEAHHQATLMADDLTVERRRRSTATSPPFEMHVDSFALHSGELVTLTGPNGSGKSSFSRLLCGLDEPKGGSILLNGKRQGTKELNRSVGYLFQNPDRDLPADGEEELVWSLRRRRERSTKEIEAQVGDAAELRPAPCRYPTTMSYPKRKALQAAVYYLLIALLHPR